MKSILFFSIAIWAFVACTTKETKETTTIETVEVPVSPPVDEPVPPAPQPATTPAPEKDNKFELEMSSDSGAKMKIKVP